jgi:signal transduction histidine kinase
MAVNGPPAGGGAVIIFSRDAQSAPAPAVPLDEQVLPPMADTVYAVSASPFGYGFAVKGVIASERRSSQVVSIPLDGSLGTLEISNGPAYGSDILRSVAIAWAIAGILSIALAALAGWYASKQVTQPVLVLTDAAHRMEGGNLSARVALPGEKQEEFTALAHAFNGMAAQVENTISTLRAFVSDAAHELNTPLTALKTNLELAAAETNATQQQEFLARALEQNQRLEKLTSGLLDLSRIEAAADAASGFEPLDLRQAVAQVGERFASRADQAGRNFTLTLPKTEVKILGNVAQLDRVLSNLLENALKFTPESGNISLVLEKNENTATLTIADTGIGIPPEDLPHLFERFHRGRNSSSYPGNGLGLAIVKASVAAHKGNIRV